MFGELLFSFDSLKLGISYKVKNCKRRCGQARAFFYSFLSFPGRRKAQHLFQPVYKYIPVRA